MHSVRTFRTRRQSIVSATFAASLNMPWLIYRSISSSLRLYSFLSNFFTSPSIYRFQVCQENRISTGNSSRRPAIISNVSTIFAKGEYSE